MGSSSGWTERYLVPMAAFAGQLDAEAWPLVVLKPTAYPTKDSLEGLDVALGELLDRGERFCLLGDLSHKNGMELHEVQHLQALFEEQGERLDRQVVAFGLAIPSAMVPKPMSLPPPEFSCCTTSIDCTTPYPGWL